MPSAVSVPVVALKVALEYPAATVTVAGTDSARLSVEIATEAPTAGAAPLKVTVQRELPPDPREDGLHASEDGATTVTTAPAAVVVTGEPFGSLAMVPVRPIAVDCALGASVRVTVATNPEAIPVVFMPESMQA